MHDGLADASSQLSRTVATVPDLPDKVAPKDIAAFTSALPGPGVLIGSEGQELARTGAETGIWSRPSSGLAGSVAAAGVSGTVIDGAIEVRRTLGANRIVIVRRDLGAGATSIETSTLLWIGGLAALLGFAAGAAVFLTGRRAGARIDNLAHLAENIAAGRPVDDATIPVDGPYGRLGTALKVGAERLKHLGEIADRELGLLSAAIEPLPVGVSGRGPAGGRIRNLALERMLEGLGAADRTAVEAAIRDGLDATDPVGDRVRLSDGRTLEVDAWTVPGGRLVSVAERSEQERLAAFRNQIEGAAVRQLRAPIDEIAVRGKELYHHVPAPAAPTLRAILAATDRLDRVVRMMLRGTSHDPAMRPPRRETFGVAGFLWALAHDWDAALRQRALRVELDIAPDLPEVRTDPALVEEILTELVDNAAKFTPRGGTIHLSARREAAELILDVRDTGPGIRSEDAPHATERFFRGLSSESIPGAGLGLGVASALAERLGGRIEVMAGDGGHVRLMLPAQVPGSAALAAA